MKKVKDSYEGQHMVMYVTKYGLTQGIIKVHGEYMEEHNMFRYYPALKDPNAWNYPAFAHRLGKDFHKTLEEAQECVRLMRGRKIAALQKKLDHFLDYTPKVVEM